MWCFSHCLGLAMRIRSLPAGSSWNPPSWPRSGCPKTSLTSPTWQGAVLTSNRPVSAIGWQSTFLDPPIGLDWTLSSSDGTPIFSFLHPPLSFGLGVPNILNSAFGGVIAITNVFNMFRCFNHGSRRLRLAFSHSPSLSIIITIILIIIAIINLH